MTRFRAAAAASAAAAAAGLAFTFASARGGAVEWCETVTLAEKGASNPTVAVDPRSGAAFAVWVETGAAEPGVRLISVESGATGVRVNDRPGDAAPHEQAPAQVAVGPEGNVYVLWANSTAIAGRRFPASDLRFARSTDGGRSFGPALTVNDDAGGPPSSHTFHDVLVGSDGTVWVSWLDSRVRDAARARRQPAPPATLSPGGDSTRHMHGHGAGAAASDEAGLPGAEIRVARSTDGGETFGPSLVVDGGVCPCCRSSLAAGPDGSIYVAWRKVFAGDVRDVVVARLAPGAASFAAPVRVHADGWVFPGCPHSGGSVAVDARGRVHVGWYTGKEGRQGLWHAVSTDGGRRFGPPSALLTGGWVPPSQVALAADGDRVWIAWDDRRVQSGEISVARSDGGRPATLGSVGSGRSPALATGHDGAVLTWHDGEAVRTRSTLR